MNRAELLEIAKPILFNTDMVRAILDDRKGVTRRLVKFLPGKNPSWTGYIKDGLMLYNGRNEPCIRPPKYKLGDYLYVRETWSTHYDGIHDDLVYCYRADGLDLKAECLPGENNWWYPSIHMPKEAARIFLRVTDVRVERLKDMTLDDFLAEGVVIRPEAFNDPENAYWQAREIFSSIWDSTIPKKDLGKYGFDANPWEWAYGFERVEV